MSHLLSLTFRQHNFPQAYLEQVGDEGGFAIPVQDNNEALDVLTEAIAASGHSDKVQIGTDVAESARALAGTRQGRRYRSLFQNLAVPVSSMYIFSGFKTVLGIS